MQPLWIPRVANEWYPLQGAGKTTFLHHEHLRKLKIRSVGEVIDHNSGQFGFGFKVSAAFLMWPCYNNGKPELSMGESATPPKVPYLKAPVYMPEPKLARDIDITMQTLTTTPTINKVKDRFKQYVVTQRLQLGRLLLNYAEYEKLEGEAWRLKLLQDQEDEAEAPPEDDAPQGEVEANSESDDERDAPTAQKGFAEVHGREEQTYAVNGKTSQVVKGYEAELGHAKEGVLELRISEERFRKEYLRILAIYFSHRGIGTKKVSFDAKEKRIGMLTGLWRHEETGPGLQNVMVPTWISKKGKAGHWNIDETRKPPGRKCGPPSSRGGIR